MSSTNRPLVTIAIPTYNRANTYLRGAIQCALDQTYPHIEILISNNCSTDNTDEVVKNFSDPRIRYIKQEKNIGPNNNFNYCINEARGEFLLLLLDDDRVDPDFIEVCIDALKEKINIGLVRTGTRMIDANDKVIFERPNLSMGLSDKDFFLAWFNNKTTLFVCSTLFKTKHLRSIGGFKSKHILFQDVIAETKVIVKYGRIDINEVKASFRWHDDNWGAGKVTAWCEDSLDLLNVICDYIPEHKEILRREGLPFFCRMNFNYALSLKTPYTRLITYYKVAKMFEYSESPLDFFLQKDLRPKLRLAKRKIKQLFIASPSQ